MLDFFTDMFGILLNWFGAFKFGRNNVLDCLQIKIGLLSLLVAVATLIVAYLTYRLAEKVQEAIASNHAKQKRVEAMCNLVAFLNDTRIRLRGRHLNCVKLHQ